MYSEKQLREEYERGLYDGKIEVMNGLISVMNSAYGKTYETFYNLVISFVKMMTEKLESNKLK